MIPNLEEAVPLLPESPLLARVLARLADCLHFAGVVERTNALSRDALAMARRLGDPEALIVTLVARHTALLHVEHLDERLALSEEIISVAEAGGSRELLGLGLWWHIYDLMESGQVGAARDDPRAENPSARCLLTERGRLRAGSPRLPVCGNGAAR